MWPYLLEVYPIGLVNSKFDALNREYEQAYTSAFDSWSQLESAQSALKVLMKKLAESDSIDGVQGDREAGEECVSMYVESDTTADKTDSILGEISRPGEGKRTPSVSTNSSDVGPPMKNGFQSEVLSNGVDGESNLEENSLITIELEEHTKCASDRKEVILMEMTEIFEKLPLEMRSQLETDDDNRWNYQKFLEV